jgi:hypothetical protein
MAAVTYVRRSNSSAVMQPKDPTSSPPEGAAPAAPKHFANPGSHRRTAQSRWFAGSRPTPDVPPAGLTLHGSFKPRAAKDQPRIQRPAAATSPLYGKGSFTPVPHNTRSPE